MMTSSLSIIIATLLLSASWSPAHGFASLRCIPNSSRSSSTQSLVSQRTNNFDSHHEQRQLLSIQRMTSEDEESEATESQEELAPSSKEATAGGGTIALTSAKSAADAASAATTNTTSIKSPSTTGFSLILLPTLLFKFTIVLIVKFATDVVVYPILYLWRWARLGRKKIGRGLGRLLGREESRVVNGTSGGDGGESVGDFQ